MPTSATGESALLLLDVVQVLSKEQVDYAIVGYGADTVRSLENLQGDLVREKDSGLELD